MRATSIWKVAGVAVGLAWAAAATAQSTGASTGTPLSQRQLEGRVTAVDTHDHQLTLDTRDRATNAAPAYRQDRSYGSEGQAWNGDVERAPNAKLFVAPRAAVVRDGVNVPLEEVQPGDEVRASFLTDDPTRTHPWKIEASSPSAEAPSGVGTGG